MGIIFRTVDAGGGATAFGILIGVLFIAAGAGRRIVEEAVDMRAAAIVLALPRRVDGASLFGKTLETVLAERPCRVVIESTPPPEGHTNRRRALEKARVAG